MLQFATTNNKTLNLASQVALAIEGGISWIRITGHHKFEDLEALVAPCQDAGTILVLDNDIEMVDKLRIHGLHLTEWTRGSVIAAREKLGPHAILGVTCDNSEAIDQLKGLDLDYVVIPEPESGDPMKYYTEFVAELLAKTKDVHPVASGDIPPVAIRPLLSTGIEGFQLSSEILEAADPLLAIKEFQAMTGDIPSAES